MDTYITRKQIREINRKLYANDIWYSDDGKGVFEEIVSSIIQRYDPQDKMSNVPSVLEIKKPKIDKKTIENILLLDRKSVIVQVNNRLLADVYNLDMVKELKAHKYKIMIELNKDDKIFTISTILADIIKIDINNIPDVILSPDIHFNGKILAYNINTPEQYAAATAMHADLYEGNYITEGSNIRLEVKENISINFIEVMSLITKDNVEMHDLASAISKDVIMSAQVVRLANSVFYTGKEKISSIEQALVRIGLDTLKKWIFLLQFNRNSAENEELLQLAYSRALFCEKMVQVSKKIKISETDAYLIGLFSTIDALTGKSIDKQIHSMNLSSTIEDALIYREGHGGLLLNTIKSYEEAHWDKVAKYSKQIGISKDKMSEIYFYCVDEVSRFWGGLGAREAR